MIFVILATIAALGLAHYYFTKQYKYWEEHGIIHYIKHNRYVETYRFMFKKFVMFDDILADYNALPDKQVFGIYAFGLPQLMIKDPDILRNICVKDFDHFVNHTDAFFKNDRLFGKSLFALKDKKWRDMRTIMTPVFTASKLRLLIQLLSECGEQINIHYSQKYKDQSDKVLKIDIMDMSTRFTNDVIASSAFGIKVNSVTDPKNEFYLAGSEIIKFPAWRFLMLMMLPTLSKLLKLGFAPKYVYDFFINCVEDTIRERQKQNIIRYDIIHLLLEARKEQIATIEAKRANNEDVDALTNNLLTDEDITAQAFVFFLAGYSNVAILMSFASYELAVNPDIQTKLHNEIETAINEKGKLDYDVIKKMKYLDMVVSETLRKWPPLAAIDRVCNKTYKIEANDDIVEVKPGMIISIPVLGLHYDPKYFPNPEKFDPERFNDENKAKMNPYTYMPFGIGPRICIANRFVILETKLFLIHLLLKFNIVPTEKTPIPLILAPGNVLKPKDDFNLGLKLRN